MQEVKDFSPEDVQHLPRAKKTVATTELVHERVFKITLVALQLNERKDHYSRLCLK